MYEVSFIIILAVHAVLTPTLTSTSQLPTGKCVHVTASAVLLNHIINPLGAMLIYICTRMPTAHRDAHIYMHALLTNTYRA